MLACNLRSNDDTWVSTVRSDTYIRAAISAFVSCSPSPASTSASLRVTPLAASGSAIGTMIAPTARLPARNARPDQLRTTTRTGYGGATCPIGARCDQKGSGDGDHTPSRDDAMHQDLRHTDEQRREWIEQRRASVVAAYDAEAATFDRHPYPNRPQQAWVKRLLALLP